MRKLKALLISANTEQMNMPTLPLGLACVAEATRQGGHEALLLDLMGKDNPTEHVIKSIGDLNPNVVGISVRNIDNQSMDETVFLLEPVRDIVSTCMGISGATVVIGGAGYSMFPEACLAYLDAPVGICGEGEAGFTELLDRMAEGRDPAGTPGLYIRGLGCRTERRIVPELDTLPLPGRDTWGSLPEALGEVWMPVQSRRGCPMGCSYCSTAQIEGESTRRRNPMAVAEWMAGWAEAGVRNFYFVDNTFNIPPAYAKDLCRAIIEKTPGISFQCIIYPNRLDEELAGLMAKAGCVHASLGFESGAEPVLNLMNKRFSPGAIREVSETLGRFGIRRMGFLMFGGPGETKETVTESIEFADSLGLESVRVTKGIRIYPGTELAGVAVKEGVITPDDDLLYPRFYLATGLEPWLGETLQGLMKERPNWIF